MTNTGKDRECWNWGAVAKFLAGKDETIYAKLFVATFDKLILGALLLIIGTSIQNEISENSYRTELTSKMLESQTELISTYRQQLVGRVGLFLFNLEKIKLDPIKTAELSLFLENILEEVRIDIESIGAFYSKENFIVDVDPLLKTMSNAITTASDAALAGQARIESINGTANRVRDAARVVYSAIEKATIAEAVQDAQQLMTAR